MQRPITRGAAANTGLIFHIFAQDSASTVGAGKASVAFSSWACRYIRNGEAISGAITPEDITTIGTYAAPTANTNIRIKAVDNTNMIGVYEVHVHLDWVNVTNTCQSLTIYLTATGVAVLPIQIPLIGINMQDGVRAGLTALPNAAAEAAGGLFTRGTGAGQVNQAANGMIDTNPVRLNNVSQSLLDLKDFADDGYDPATNKVQGLVLVDTLTTYTGNTPQTGDVFPLASTEIADIKAKTDNLPTDPADASDIAAAVAIIQADTDNIQTRLPAALTANGNMKSSVMEFIATALTETSGQIAAAFKKFFDKAAPTGTVNSIPDAVAGASDGLFIAGSNAATTANITGNITGNLSGSVGSVTGAVGSVTAGVTLAASAVQAIWDALTSALTTVGSIGKRIADFLTGDAFVRIGAAGAGLTALGDTRITNLDATVSSRSTPAQVNTEADTALLDAGVTSARMGYVDNLNIGGNVASSAEAVAIQNNTRVVRVVPPVIERPDSGTQEFRIELFLYDDVGNMEAPDSAPTIALVNQAGTDLTARLDSATMASVSTGRYRAIYTAAVADTLEQLVWTFSVVEGGATRLYGNTSLIVDTSAVDFTAADRTKLNTLHDTRIPGVIQPQTGDSFARLGTPAGASVSADVVAVKSQTAAIETDTQDLQSRTPAALVSGRMDSSVGAMAANTLTASALATDAVNELVDQAWREAIADHSAVAGSTAEALAAAGSAGDPWVTALPGAYGAGSAGKLVGDNLNATVGSRASQTSVDDLPTNAELATALATADDAVLAAIAALNNLSQANIRTAIGLASANLDTQLGDLPTNAELATALGTADDAVLAAIAALNNLSQAGVRSAVGLASANLDTQIAALATAANLALAKIVIDAIKLKTDGLPSDPADASDVASAFSTVNSSLSTIAGYLDTEILAIKAKTDLLPASPAGVGSAMTLASGERDSIAAALLDLTDGVESGWTIRQVQKQVLAMAAGVTRGMGTVQGSVENPAGTKIRVIATIDLDGNRTPTSWDNS